MAVLTVQDVRCCDVIQGVMLQGWRGRVKLGGQWQWVSRAVSGSWADGANPLCGRLHSYRWAFTETVLFSPEGETGVI